MTIQSLMDMCVVFVQGTNVGDTNQEMYYATWLKIISYSYDLIVFAHFESSLTISISLIPKDALTLILLDFEYVAFQVNIWTSMKDII